MKIRYSRLSLLAIVGGVFSLMQAFNYSWSLETIHVVIFWIFVILVLTLLPLSSLLAVVALKIENQRIVSVISLLISIPLIILIIGYVVGRSL